MRRRVAGMATLVGLVVAVSFASAGAAATKHARAFTQTDLGAQISMNGTSFQTAYKVTDSLDGSGASVQTGKVSGTAFPLSGSDSDIAYFANGVGRTKDTFKLGTPDANGISAITGHGKCVGGTGIHKTEKCSYSFTGTYNTKTTIAKVKVTGTVTR
jgi:hypothetical protein